MKKIILVLLIFCYSNIHSQHFLQNFEKENFDKWGFSNLTDEFGDPSNKTVYPFITKGYHLNRSDIKEEIYVIVTVDLQEEFVSFDIYNSDYDLITKINYSGEALVKNMATNEIKTYYFNQGKEYSLIAPLRAYEDKIPTPVKYILNGNGEVIKFKLKELNWASGENKGEYYFEIISWNNDIREKTKVDF